MQHKTIEKLQKKADCSFSENVRMPSISEISKMLDELGVIHHVSESTNIVEYRSRGNRYVNSRHSGKVGKRLKISGSNIDLDTSDSYYSWNSQSYAQKILAFLKNLGKI